MNKYYAKIRIDYLKKTCRGVQLSLPTFGTDEQHARLMVENLISGWNDVKAFEILKISTRPIHLYKYEVIGVCKFKFKPEKKLFFVLFAENKAEAEDLFRLKTEKFFGLTGTEILSNEVV
jgi:hypothetical protein